MANVKQVAQTLEELGLFADLGLPELDELIPPPAELLKKIGIPTPRDLLLAARQTIETALPAPRAQQPAPARQPTAQQAEIIWLPPPLPLLPPLPLPPLPRLRGPGGP